MHALLALLLGLGLLEPAPRSEEAAAASVVAPRLEPAAMPVPDPALVARNRRLTARSQRGDRFLITGRIVGSAAGLLLGGGIAMLVVDHVTDRERHDLLVAGAVLTAVGGAAQLVSGGLSFYGKREIEAARRGELPMPRHARLSGSPAGLRVRF